MGFDSPAAVQIRPEPLLRPSNTQSYGLPPPKDEPSLRPKASKGGRGMQIGNLTIDPLAVGALVGFGSLLVIMFILIIWIWRKAGKGPGEV